MEKQSDIGRNKDNSSQIFHEPRQQDNEKQSDIGRHTYNYVFQDSEILEDSGTGR